MMIVHTGIWRGAITAYVGVIGVLPFLLGTVTAGQRSGDQDELDVFCLFHGLRGLPGGFGFGPQILFHGDEDLIILGHFDGFGIPVRVFSLRRDEAQGGYGISVYNGLVLAEIDPYLMSG